MAISSASNTTVSYLILGNTGNTIRMHSHHEVVSKLLGLPQSIEVAKMNQIETMGGTLKFVY